MLQINDERNPPETSASLVPSMENVVLRFPHLYLLAMSLGVAETQPNGRECTRANRLNARRTVSGPSDAVLPCSDACLIWKLGRILWTAS